MRPTGKARVAGVVGWPVAHSLSPRLQGYWLERYGVDGAYVPLPVRPLDLPLAFESLPRLGFLGWNVTLPHKEAAFRLVGERDAAAERMGAVNTVLVLPDGRTRGLNTDGYGFLTNLREQVPDWWPEAGPAALLGAGGAARGVAVALLEAGLPGLRIANRTRGRAESLASDLRRLFARPIEVVDWLDAEALLKGAGLCVNATSLGMAHQPPLGLDLGALPLKAPVADLVYAPLETQLLRHARERGHPVVDGLGMLLHQAVPGFTHWGGCIPAVEQGLRTHLLEVLAAR
jgi:shikimate dehydrogenase